MKVFLGKNEVPNITYSRYSQMLEAVYIFVNYLFHCMSEWKELFSLSSGEYWIILIPLDTLYPVVCDEMSTSLQYLFHSPTTASGSFERLSPVSFLLLF